MEKQIKRVVILGGGTAGWMSAALLKKVLGNAVYITLVESEEIGSVGVGEATIPPIRQVNAVLGLDEAEFLRETQATIKLAIRFENWWQHDQYYYHTFGAPGKSFAFCDFHHYWLRAKQQGVADDIWQYDLNYLCAEAGKFAPIHNREPLSDIPYAYHFDASLYARFLRKHCEPWGVTRIEGKVRNVNQCPKTGFVEALVLESGQQIDGDLFIDCSGFKGLLIQQTLGTGFDDWRHLLPCDSAIAVPSERLETTLPFTRSIARSAGWQWRIPLQHRNGNGLVYCSRFISDDDAQQELMSNLDSQPLADPKRIRFTTGRVRQPWKHNVIAVGLASGFLEPLESTSIHLIQSAIVRFLKLFPHQGIQQSAVSEYNRQTEEEYLQIRDFLVLHYYQTQRRDTAFWREVAALPIPESLQHKLALFKQSGSLMRSQPDLFLDSSWLQVMLGQGIEPDDFHPLAGVPDMQQLRDMLENIKRIKSNVLQSLPKHDEFLRSLYR